MHSTHPTWPRLLHHCPLPQSTHIFCPRPKPATASFVSFQQTSAVRKQHNSTPSRFAALTQAPKSLCFLSFCPPHWASNPPRILLRPPSLYYPGWVGNAAPPQHARLSRHRNTTRSGLVAITLGSALHRCPPTGSCSAGSASGRGSCALGWEKPHVSLAAVHPLGPPLRVCLHDIGTRFQLEQVVTLDGGVWVPVRAFACDGGQ